MPRFFIPTFLVIAVAVTAPLFMNQNAANGQADGPKPKDGGSYAVGLNVGGSLKQGGFSADDISTDDFIMGMLDALKGADPRLTDEELQKAGQVLETKLTARAQEMAKANLAKAKAFLDENKSKDGVQTLPSGLQIKELKKGDGAQPKLNSTVKVHYEGKLINGTVFDSSIKRGEPIEFPVRGVIPGWTEALQRMRVGDKWMLFIPPELAYGASGSPGAIGPNEALIFEVELLDVDGAAGK